MVELAPMDGWSKNRKRGITLLLLLQLGEVGFFPMEMQSQTSRCSSYLL